MKNKYWLNFGKEKSILLFLSVIINLQLKYIRSVINFCCTFSYASFFRCDSEKTFGKFET